MIKIHHLNCVEIDSPVGFRAIGHCLLLETADQLILIDAGIGLADRQQPLKHIGKELIEMIGYDFQQQSPAIQQIQQLGLDPAKVEHCIISHLDHDHISGLTDFPQATVHVGLEEFNNYQSGNPRYLQHPLAHAPTIKTYGTSQQTWFGLEARPVALDFKGTIFLIPLFGHTQGHCGVAIQANEQWIFYVGDAYYYKVELFDPKHPVSLFAAQACEDTTKRLASLQKIKTIVEQHPDILTFGFHDPNEFQSSYKKKPH